MFNRALRGRREDLRKGEGLFTQEGAGALQGHRGAFTGIQEGVVQSQAVLSAGEGGGGGFCSAGKFRFREIGVPKILGSGFGTG